MVEETEKKLLEIQNLKREAMGIVGRDVIREISGYLESKELMSKSLYKSLFSLSVNAFTQQINLKSY